MERKQVCVLPDCVPLDATQPASGSSRFLRLPHPRTNQASLFLPFSPSNARPIDGLLEVQKVSLDADKSRCWFLPDEIISDGSLHLFSPFDPVFLIIAYFSLLAPHYQSYADLWDAVAQLQFRPETGEDAEPDTKGVEPGTCDYSEDIGRLAQLECVKKRLLDVCETQEHESTLMYRLSHVLVLEVLRAKVDALARTVDGIFGPLEATELGEQVKPEDAPQPACEDDRNQPQAAKRFPTVSRGLAKEGAGSGHGLSEELQNESRQKYAIGIIANYLPPKLAQDLLASYPFPALAAYLSSSTDSSVLGTTYLPGRAAAKLEAALAGGDSGGGAAAKKRKAAESKGSRGVEALKKVNTKGMTSLRDMFGRQATKKPEPKPEESASARKKRKT